MNKINQRRKSVMLILLAILFLIMSWVTLLPSAIVSADTVRDFEFNEADYSFNENDHSLKLIQIAESETGKLYVYVYQPSGAETFSLQIRLSQSISENAIWQDYFLTDRVAYTDTVFRYAVDGLELKPDALRYYDIPALYRKYDKDYDGELDGENIGGYISFAVKQLWTATTVNGQVSYTMQENASIVVTSQYVGQIYYGNPGMFLDEGTTSFYIAFDTDIRMDDIYEADISYGIIGEHITTGAIYEIVPYQTVTITAEGEASAKVGWSWFAQTHTWKDIQSKDDFVKAENLNDETKDILKTKKWVIRFHNLYSNDGGPWVKPLPLEYRATDTTILRLNYVRDGKTYNVGVVSDKQSSGTNIDNVIEDWSFKDWWESVKAWFKKYWHWLVIAVVGVIAIIILSPFLPLIFTAIGHLFVLLFKGLWWLISAPVRLIVALFKKE
ncbi:MAG: hypothetical protein HDT28_01930 [Clostridiales bacterium]|nr:hypothetical protein [Clostridiales bacterium]